MKFLMGMKRLIQEGGTYSRYQEQIMLRWKFLRGLIEFPNFLGPFCN